jgi:hypothetical protein
MELKTWTRKSNAEAAVKKALAKMDVHEDILITGVEAADVGVGDAQAWAVKVFAEIAEGATIANDEFDSFTTALEPLAEVELALTEEDAGLDSLDMEEDQDADLDSLGVEEDQEADLDSLGMNGVGVSEKSAECPFCGINHLDNGYSRHEPEDGAVHTEREWACLGCGGEWGAKIKRRASSGRNSPHRGSKIFVSGGKDATNPFRPKSKSHAAFEFVQSNPGTKFEDLQGFGVRIRTITECLRKGTMRSTIK